LSTDQSYRFLFQHLQRYSIDCCTDTRRLFFGLSLVFYRSNRATVSK
jgi:hypothetical protein